MLRSTRQAVNNATDCTLSSSSSSSSSIISIASISVSSSSEEEMSDQSSLSFETDDEIPIWVNREQRWISGITSLTTCGQLIEVLLRNEGMLSEDIDATHTANTISQYVITERWRRVEQMLDNNTKVLKIWKAWGQTRPEVRLTLRRTETLLKHSKHGSRNRPNRGDDSNDRDSPVSRADSWSAKRKRHRSSKSTTNAWSKHAREYHPKSSKASIERLMELILEQGETIQQQLSKLRDRENQIAKYETGHRGHRVHSENDMGKHYLLETYLNGLHEIDTKCGTTTSNDDKIDTDKELTTPGNSDSGVNTEEIATSPDVGRTGSSSSNSDTNNPNDKQIKEKSNDPKENANLVREKTAKKASSHRKPGDTSREAKLRAEHQLRKKFCEKMEIMHGEKANKAQIKNVAPTDDIEPASVANEISSTTSANERKELNVNDHLAGQIELLEKVISINKHIQREEELLVRLNAKIRKYEVGDPNLSETEMKKVLDRINANIDESSTALTKTEHELDASQQMLITKAQMVEELNEELKALELNEAISGNHNVIHVPSHQIQIHSPSELASDVRIDEQKNEQRQMHVEQTIVVQPSLPATVIPLVQTAPLPAPLPPMTPATTSPPTTAQFAKPMKTGTLPKLISSVLKKTSQLSAKNTFSGTIPKVKQQPQCNRILSTVSNRNAVVAAANGGGAATVNGNSGNGTNATQLNSMQTEKNNSAYVADQLMLSQAPLFYQKTNANGMAMQLIDQRNLKTNNFNMAPAISNANNANNCNSININNTNSTMANCSKIGPKKLINGFYKDPDTDTGLSSLGDGILQHVGTLV